MEKMHLGANWRYNQDRAVINGHDKKMTIQTM